MNTIQTPTVTSITQLPLHQADPTIIQCNSLEVNEQERAAVRRSNMANINSIHHGNGSSNAYATSTSNTNRDEGGFFHFFDNICLAMCGGGHDSTWSSVDSSSHPVKDTVWLPTESLCIDDDGYCYCRDPYYHKNT